MAWVVVGLGNPGDEYADTRHNAGRMALEYYASKSALLAWKVDKKANAATTGAKIGKHIVLFVLPNTYMNKSGAAVKRYIKSIKAAEQLIVVYDELDMPLGSMKVSFDRGSGGHKGLESIIKAVKTKRFTRIRIGISPSTAAGALRKPRGEQDVVDFILKKFKAAEIEQLKRVFKKTNEAIECIITEGPVMAMNKFNS